MSVFSWLTTHLCKKRAIPQKRLQSTACSFLGLRVREKSATRYELWMLPSKGWKLSCRFCHFSHTCIACFGSCKCTKEEGWWLQDNFHLDSLQLEQILDLEGKLQGKFWPFSLGMELCSSYSHHSWLECQSWPKGRPKVLPDSWLMQNAPSLLSFIFFSHFANRCEKSPLMLNEPILFCAIFLLTP